MNLSKLNLDELESWAKVVGNDSAGRGSDPCECPVSLFIEQVILDPSERGEVMVTGQALLYEDQRHELPRDVAEVVDGIDESYDNYIVSGNAVVAIIQTIREG